MDASINQAFSNWTTANQSNGSSVSFVPTDGKAHTYTFTVNASSGLFINGAGQPDKTVYASTAWGNGSATTTWYLDAAPLNPSDPSTFPAMVKKGQLHEIGHTMDLSDQSGNCKTQVPGQSVMNMACSPSGPPSQYNDAANNMPSIVANCDNQAVQSEPGGGGGSGSGGDGGGTGCVEPTNLSCPGSAPVCNWNTGLWQCQNGEAGCEQPEPAPCCDDCYVECASNGWECIGSPIVLDVYGKGFHFTDIKNGVRFRVLPDQDLRQMSWPEPGSHDGWLALDRNGDGQITDFTELFGNATPQPKSDHPNGYLALAVFDDPENGGNANGFIDPDDAVYDHLRVWTDDNHNGVSEANELHTLRELGIFRIDLTYHLSRHVDKNGNVFRYKSRVWDEAGREHETCYDVFVRIAY